MDTTRVCDVCRHTFKGGKRKRWWCAICDKYYYVCPDCLERDRVPCPHCGVTLQKKAEPIEK